MFGNPDMWTPGYFPHQEMRFSVVEEFLNTGDVGDFFFDDYLESIDEYFEKIKNLWQDFPSDYRRMSQPFDVEIDPSTGVTAYAKAAFPGKAFISRGLILSILDACQTIVTDHRSTFAGSIDEVLQGGDSPGVLWAPELSDLLDVYRYNDYETIWNVLQRGEHYPIYLLHKFVSASAFRQGVGDLLSSFSTIWVLAHEDAHHYLGHLHYLNMIAPTQMGASPGDFDEFLNLATTEEERRIRIAAELAADKNACMVLVDQVCSTEMFEINSFLYKNLLYLPPHGFNNERQLEKSKTIYLFRLCTVSVAINLAIFERNTIKNSSVRLFYPTFSTRILNCIIALTERMASLASGRPDTGIVKLTDEEWMSTFRQTHRDIDVVLNYFFEIGFVLEDKNVGVKTAREVLDFHYDQHQAAFLMVCLKFSGSLPADTSQVTEEGSEKIIASMKQRQKERPNPILKEIYSDDMLDCIMSIQQLSLFGNETFADSRYAVNPKTTDKVTDSLRRESLLFSRINLSAKMIKRAYEGL